MAENVGENNEVSPMELGQSGDQPQLNTSEMSLEPYGFIYKAGDTREAMYDNIAQSLSIIKSSCLPLNFFVQKYKFNKALKWAFSDDIWSFYFLEGLNHHMNLVILHMEDLTNAYKWSFQHFKHLWMALVNCGAHRDVIQHHMPFIMFNAVGVKLDMITKSSGLPRSSFTDPNDPGMTKLTECRNDDPWDLQLMAEYDYRLCIASKNMDQLKEAHAKSVEEFRSLWDTLVHATPFDFNYWLLNVKC